LSVRIYRYQDRRSDFPVKLVSVDVIKDLGVVFHSELSFVSHRKDKINRAYSMQGLIKRNFIYLTEETVTLYKSLVRCHLEYANSVWNPHRQGLINDLEKVQMRATKLVLTVKHLTYNERLVQGQGSHLLTNSTFASKYKMSVLYTVCLVFTHMGFKNR